MPVSRRDFFLKGGLAAAGSAGLVLRADARPTLPSGTLNHYPEFRKILHAGLPDSGPLPGDTGQSLPATTKPTEENILGPYYREGAPFRAKVTPPLEKGTVLSIRGRVWGFDTKKPLPGVVLDIWQANADGRYDNDDPAKPPANGIYLNRTRVLTDETGYYEFETVHPGPYKIGPDAWRPSHIHYMVRKAGYTSLVTQLYFEGDRFNKTDEFIKPSLVIPLNRAKVGGQVIETGVFDVVLAPAAKK